MTMVSMAHRQTYLNSFSETSSEILGKGTHLMSEQSLLPLMLPRDTDSVSIMHEMFRCAFCLRCVYFNLMFSI
jgi:hypothetical protein